MQTGDFAETPLKLHSNIIRKNKTKRESPTENVKQMKTFVNTQPPRKQKVFSTYVTAVATLTCRGVVSVITLCNHPFSMGRESGEKMRLCLLEQASSSR